MVSRRQTPTESTRDDGKIARLPRVGAREKLMISVARVAATLNAEHDLEKVLDLICHEALNLFAADTAVLWENQGESLVAVKALGLFGPQIQGVRVPIDDTDTIACRCFRRRSPVLEHHLLEGQGNRSLLGLPPAAVVLCVPLIHRDEGLGVLGLRDRENPHRFSTTDQKAVSLFAGLAAVAIANARLQGEAEKRAREAAVLNRIGRIVASGRDMVETSEAFARELRNLLPFQRVSIALLEGADKYRVFLATGLDAREFRLGTMRGLAGSGVEWVTRHGRSHVIYDLELEQAFPSDPVYAALGMRSVLRVPLIERGEALGAITLVSDTPGSYGSREVELMEQVAGQMAGVFANAQMAEIELGLLSRLSSLHRVTDAALSTLDLDSLLDSLLERCVEIVGADGGMVLMLDEGGKEFTVRRARWIPGEEPREIHPGLGEGISGKVTLSGKPRLILEVDEEDPADVVVTRQRGIHSVLALPLTARGRSLGVFRLDSRRPACFQDEHLRLMEIAAERMALAIDNARLLQEARARADLEALIHQIASTVGSSLDLNQVVDRVVKELQRATAASRCLVVLSDAKHDRAQWRWEALAPSATPSVSMRVPLENLAMRDMLVRSGPVIMHDIESFPITQAMRETMRNLGVMSLLATPLLRGGELIGMLMLQQTDRCRHWTQWEAELVRSVAAQMVVAVENSRLYSETDERMRARVRELRGLLRLSRAISEQLSLDVVMERAVEEGVRVLDADRCSLAVADWGRRVLVVRAAAQREPGEAGTGIGMEIALREYPHSARAMAEREPMVLTVGHPTVSPAEEALLLRLNTRTGIVVPLVVGDRAFGTAFLGRTANKPGFSEDEVALARAMAEQVAVAMENARLFQEVQAEKARTGALLSSIGEGVCATDEEDRITSVNPWLEAMVGHRAEEMAGRRCRDVLRHTDEQGASLCDSACPLRTAFDEGKPTEPAVMFTQTAWGDRLPTVVSAAPIRNELSEIIGAVFTSRDVSREWQMDKLKSNIISVVSHEFRTPLTSIIGFSELLATRDQTEEEKKSCAGYIYDEGLKLEALVNDFLDVSRLDAGRVALNPEPLVVPLVVEQCVAESRSRTRTHRLLTDLPADLPQVEADPERLAQVLENLISNAIKYSSPGTDVVVRARPGWQRGNDILFQGESPCRWVVFTVEDQGFGIPEDQLPDIFTPFHRVQGELTRRIRGTGLGLSIVKSLVELHGGKLWVESEVGVGSKFHVALKTVGES